MKICPTCQQQYPNGFQYCPNDTDVLVTAEEFLRRTKPIAATLPPIEAPAQAVSEAPQITRQPAIEAPRTPITEPVKPPTAAFTSPPVMPRAESSAPRQAPASAPTTPVSTPASQVAMGGFNASQRNAAPANPATANGKNAKQSAVVAGVAAVTGTAFGKSAELSFSVPEEGGLIHRLSAAIQNISDSFAKGGGGKAGDTGDFKFLIKDETLVSRIGRELSSASTDFKRDPKGFVVATVKGEGNSKRRQQLLLNGIALATIAYSLIFFIGPAIMILLWGNRPVIAEEKKDDDLKMLAELTAVPIDANKPKSADKSLGSKPIPKKSSGGGGGGREQPTPPSKGRPPQMALTPQIILPNPEPPKIKNPSLVVASTIYGDPKTMPPMKGPIGDPLGVPAPPSSGPGKGGGIGSSDGTGVGRGQGGGLGAGRGGNTGGGDMDIGGGRGIEEMGKNGVGRPTILSREKAKYTEEARQNKVQGTVVLSVIFTADGRISNIKTIRGLPDGLTEKAIEAAQKIRFQPATKNGQAVSVRGNLEFTFNLY